jgi:hypothetical protein
VVALDLFKSTKSTFDISQTNYYHSLLFINNMAKYIGSLCVFGGSALHLGSEEAKSIDTTQNAQCVQAPSEDRKRLQQHVRLFSFSMSKVRLHNKSNLLSKKVGLII